MAQYQEADLLYRKGLTTYSISKAEKALKKVIKYERFGLALSLTRLLSHCYSHLSMYNEMEATNEEEKNYWKYRKSLWPWCIYATVSESR